MTKKQKTKTLDWLAEQACAVLEVSCGKDYADAKRRRLAGEDRFKVLVWLNELDSQNLAALANRVGVSASSLDVTRRTVRSL
ncbi:MAG TPA: hypothetical protein PLE99_16125 [Candidatus Thiothrix moscowensis]|uniref:hypothetical protein n=1 Tax=unclassified Thiothrix TaxID=2636184 RepID=UPI0025E176CA|nr:MULTISPECIES: hypothetical protein [unclassified Thiothrix]HRJ54288.1 hypothetical protein [Candidatus Thiothrix moscowensis]HRJ94524.1 hypothetical protein [Candidatus Thiothrix moscowensis]